MSYSTIASMNYYTVLLIYIAGWLVIGLYELLGNPTT